jgi:hypothetical protein
MLKWNQRIPELETAGIQLIMVSIGVPEKGRALMEHLDIPKGYLYVDPENALYDALDLNRGIQRTFFNHNTPFAFVDRFTKGDTKELGEVLSKWSKAFYIPPKQSQAFLQGGTFVFRKNQTLFAHYDPSTAAHASIDQVMEIANEALARV